MASAGVNVDTKSRLSCCWDLDIQWYLYPDKVIEVGYHADTCHADNVMYFSIMLNKLRTNLGLIGCRLVHVNRLFHLISVHPLHHTDDHGVKDRFLVKGMDNLNKFGCIQG